MKKCLTMLAAVLVCTTIFLAGCGDKKQTTPDQPSTVTITIQNAGSCFSHTKFTVEKGTILDGSLYENVTRLNNGDRQVYFIGQWQTSEGSPFDFSQPVNESVTISPEITQLYTEVDNYPVITVTANQDLKENQDMTTVILPRKSPYNGNSISTLAGSDSEGAIFNGFNYIQTAVMPEYISYYQGSIFYDCSGLKEVYFTSYGYYLNRSIPSNFLEGCDNLEKLYFSNQDDLDDFSRMLTAAIEEYQSDSVSTANIERFASMLEVKTPPDMTWRADSGLYE